MAVNQLYDTFFRQVRQLWSDLGLPVVRNLAWCLCGMYLSRSVQLHHIAANPREKRHASLSYREQTFETTPEKKHPF